MKRILALLLMTPFAFSQAPTLINATPFNYGSAGTNNPTVTIPITTAGDSLIVVQMGTSSTSGAPTDSRGSTYTAGTNCDQRNAYYSACYYSLNIPGAVTSVTINQGGGPNGYILQVRGASSVGAADFYNPGYTNASSANLSVTLANQSLVVCLGNYLGGTPTATGASWANLSGTPSLNLYKYATVTAAGAARCNATWDGSAYGKPAILEIPIASSNAGTAPTPASLTVTANPTSVLSNSGTSTFTATCTLSDGSTPACPSLAITSPSPGVSISGTTGTFTTAETATIYANATGYTQASTTVQVRDYLSVPTLMRLTPQGGALPTGSTLQFSVTCSYAVHADDDCTFAGGAVWSTPTLSSKFTISASGLATWISDPGSGNVQDGAWGWAVATAAGVSERALVIGQHIGDTWYEYFTPFVNNNINNAGTAQPNYVTVGAKFAVGVGVAINNTQAGYTAAYPFSGTCSWSSSDTSKATIDKHGIVTPIAPGDVTLTCGRAGSAVYGTSTSAGWQTPGNYLTVTVQNGGTSNQTWYVRQDGGTPYDATYNTAGTCDGLGDAAVSGSTPNQHCAFGNFKYLYMDNHTAGRIKWKISGGDTVIVRQKTAGYDMAMEAPGTGTTNCLDPTYCDINDIIPAGTAARHTKILGENYASCHADSAKTLLNLNGRAGFNMKDSQYVDIACFKIADKAACAADGEFTNHCGIGTDYFGRIGILQSALTSEVNYTDIFIDGLAGEGIHGPAGNKSVHGDYIHIRAAAMAGINFDDTPWAGNISVAGGWNMTNSIVEFSGCVEEYPVTHSYPYIECRDQSTAPSAPLDGFGTGAMTGDFIFDHDQWLYNMQDGLDALHAGEQSMTVTNNISIGNDGQAYKIGPADLVVFRNNVAMVNCQRVGQVIGDEPSSAIVPGVTLCRAAGDWVPLQFNSFGTYYVQNNSLSGYGADVFDYGCSNGFDDCTAAHTYLQNNLINGFAISTYGGGQTPGVLGGNSTLPPHDGWAVRDHNTFFGVRNIGTLQPTETLNSVDPGFVSAVRGTITAETQLDGFNSSPTSATPIGTFIAATSPDAAGNARSSSTPTQGYLQYASATQTSTSVDLVSPSTLTFAVGSSANFKCTRHFSDGSTLDCTAAATWASSTGAATLSASTYGGNPVEVATGVAAGSSTITATYGGFSGSQSVTVSAAAATLSSLAISLSSSSIAVGGTSGVTCTTTYSDGSHPTFTGTVTSTTTSVASVSGLTLTGVAAGTSAIRCTQGGVQSSPATLTVTTPATPAGGNLGGNIVIAGIALVWFKVGDEGTTLSLPPGAYVRYGFGQKFSRTFQVGASGRVAATNATFGDPFPGQVKELDVEVATVGK